MNRIVEFQKKHNLRPDGIVGIEVITKMKTVFEIYDNTQMAHFLANIDHETGGFKADTENLNYTAEALARTWPKRFSDKDKTPNVLAGKLAGQPQAIANYVYGERMGNGKEDSGDGWRFRGRGALQLTGRENYRLFSEFLKDPEIMETPDLVAKVYFWESALFFFIKNKLWQKMKGATPADVKLVRKAVNGGTIGLESVRKKFLHYHKQTQI
jgi:putative chitinase